MIVVIFEAEIRSLDAEYETTAAALRDLALTRYGCRDFVACCEGTREIAVSTWDSESDLAAWKNDPQHRQAQRRAMKKWYTSYRIRVARVERQLAVDSPSETRDPS